MSTATREPIHGWIQTRSGKQFFPDAPDPELISISDIAHALSKLCRFNGHCQQFYSVAQHSVLVSRGRGCSDKPLAALLHDAAEAYVGDVAGPLKPLLKDFQALERKVMQAVAEHFEIPLADLTDPVIKHYDMKALATEKRDLMGPEPWPWHPMPAPFPDRIEPLNPYAAEALFLDRFYELKVFSPSA